jgi:hypothetical protein
MVMRTYYGWDGDGATVWDDDTPGTQVPLTKSEESRVVRALGGIDSFLEATARSAALAKFNERCAA